MTTIHARDLETVSGGARKGPPRIPPPGRPTIFIPGRPLGPRIEQFLAQKGSTR